MRRYLVYLKEDASVHYEIEAESKPEAIRNQVRLLLASTKGAIRYRPSDFDAVEIERGGMVGVMNEERLIRFATKCVEEWQAGSVIGKYSSFEEFKVRYMKPLARRILKYG